MRPTLADSVAVVTGASSGIGLALARALAAEGGKVGLVARRGDRLAEAVDAIRRDGGVADWAEADVSDRRSIAPAIQALADRLGPVDLLVANAGVGHVTRVDPFNVAEAEAMIRVNVLGVYYAIEAVLPAMLARGRGHVAAVSSLAGYKGLPGEGAYCASKAAVNAFLDGLRVQLRGRGVDVTTICPGFVRTPMTEYNTDFMPWAMDAGPAAALILAALSRRAKVYNFPWQTTLLIRLARIAPDWAVARVLGSYGEKVVDAP